MTYEGAALRLNTPIPQNGFIQSSGLDKKDPHLMIYLPISADKIVEAIKITFDSLQSMRRYLQGDTQIHEN